MALTGRLRPSYEPISLVTWNKRPLSDFLLSKKITVFNRPHRITVTSWDLSLWPIRVWRQAVEKWCPMQSDKERWAWKYSTHPTVRKSVMTSEDFMKFNKTKETNTVILYLIETRLMWSSDCSHSVDLMWFVTLAFNNNKKKKKLHWTQMLCTEWIKCNHVFSLCTSQIIYVFSSALNPGNKGTALIRSSVIFKLCRLINNISGIHVEN